MSSTKECRHAVLQLEPSQFAELAGFERPDARSRIAATLKSDRRPKDVRKVEAAAQILSTTFPAPLVLPHDALNYDPEEPGQSFRSWLDEEERNIPSQNRKTLYVAALPEIDSKVSFMKDWTRPKATHDPASKESKVSRSIHGEGIGQGPALPPVEVEEVLDYLKAFYHGFTVQSFPRRLRFTAWGSESKARPGAKKEGIPAYVALQYGKQATRIRARACPDGAFPAQVNLDDILDAAMAMLPKDAYSLLILTEHDLYEDEDDDFCCGRAYGGSRVCVVQTARYNPLLDQQDKIDQTHVWPMSHCKDYIDKICATEDVVPVKPSMRQLSLSQSGPIRAAITFAAPLQLPSTPEQMQALWCARVARTASHELGHCLGLDHCNYYACNMQGTAGMAEDVRQPPYLCPVCEIKVTYAVACELESKDEARRSDFAMERHLAISRFCNDRERNDILMWRALGAWTDQVLPDGHLL